LKGIGCSQAGRRIVEGSEGRRKAGGVSSSHYLI
jgi:hypothetical protein